jgi:hypothetical protein
MANEIGDEAHVERSSLSRSNARASQAIETAGITFCADRECVSPDVSNPLVSEFPLAKTYRGAGRAGFRSVAGLT